MISFLLLRGELRVLSRALCRSRALLIQWMSTVIETVLQELRGGIRLNGDQRAALGFRDPCTRPSPGYLGVPVF